uniref:Uncharacterized protein n=1 Tax=Cucumis melo TaxID=3656 RepID=A0A9I9D4Y9_CUCME
MKNEESTPGLAQAIHDPSTATNEVHNTATQHHYARRHDANFKRVPFCAAPQCFEC